VTRLNLIILGILKENNATQKTSAMTIKEISKVCSIYKYNTLYVNIKNLYDNGYLLLGYKDANADTYYLSNIAVNVLSKEDVIC
jgi:hypothetical protein